MLEARIERLDDFTAIAALETFAECFATLDPSAAGDPLAAALVAAADGDASAPVEVDEPGPLARDLLRAFAREKVFQAAVEHALDTARDGHLATRPIIAVGIAASLVIIAATTRFNLDLGPVSIQKLEATPELVRELGGLLKPYVPAGQVSTGRIRPSIPKPSSK